MARATSALYYALFHHLAWTSANLLIGGAGAARSRPAWRQVYRALDHGAVRTACRNTEGMAIFPRQIADFAEAFVVMQERRHLADYDPFERFAKSQVVEDISLVGGAIAGFDCMSTKDRRAFCAYVLFKRR